MNAASAYRISARFLIVAACLLGLTLSAILVPPQAARRGGGAMVVLLPAGDLRRQDALSELASYLGRRTGLDLRLQTVPDQVSFEAALPGAILTLSPDAIALGLSPDRWQALAAARRRSPWNNRQASVLLSRRATPQAEEPWRTAPDRTVFGDSLSLVCLAPLCRQGRLEGLPGGVAWGLDPYDHRAVLAAAAHGAYDHAVVREWDALAAMSAGWMDTTGWSLRRLTRPLPDVVLFASRDLPGTARLDLQEALVLLGRNDAEPSSGGRLALVGLAALGLDGFHPLLGAEAERLRRQFGECRPGSAR